MQHRETLKTRHDVTWWQLRQQGQLGNLLADMNRLRLMDGYVDWNWNGQWKRKELWSQKFGNKGSFDEFSDNSLLLGRFRGVEEERGCQKDGKDDGEDSHGWLWGDGWPIRLRRVRISREKVKVFSFLSIVESRIFCEPLVDYLSSFYTSPDIIIIIVGQIRSR